MPFLDDPLGPRAINSWAIALALGAMPARLLILNFLSMTYDVGVPAGLYVVGELDWVPEGTVICRESLSNLRIANKF
jgi:hypothetical protein